MAAKKQVKKAVKAVSGRKAPSVRGKPVRSGKTSRPAKKTKAVARAKRPPAKKPAPKKTAPRKTPPRKAAIAPAPRPKAAPKARSTRTAKTVARRAAVSAPAKAARTAPAARPQPKTGPAGVKTKKMSAKQLEEFRKLLLNLRDRLVDGINFLAGENLNNSQREASGDLSNYGIHMADQGTDNFDREFALNMVSNEQDILYEIDEALHRIDSGTYGVCEKTGQSIELERLRAVPHTRYSLAAQTEMERGRKRYRAFGASGLTTFES